MKKTFILLILSMVFRSVGLSQCDEGFIWIDDPPLNEYNWDGFNCFYESDLNVLSDFIQINPSLTGEHLELGWQVWSDGRLEGLTLYALQITSVPDNIGDLSSLNYLNLHFNQITNIPETIGELVQLTELFLENNLIETLPESIGNLSNLVTLNINENQLISIPESIGTLGSLEELLLFNNELTFLPESICNIFPNLSYYDFSANYICPPYPDCIENVGYQDTTNCEQVSIIDETLPFTYNLHNAYPNPFNPVTILRYDLPEDAMVNITIYDMMGQVVNTLINESQSAGYKTTQWNATNDRNEPVSAGLYLYTIQAGQFTETKKMVLLK
jgi:hypothetical protein